MATHKEMVVKNEAQIKVLHEPKVTKTRSEIRATNTPKVEEKDELKEEDERTRTTNMILRNCSRDLEKLFRMRVTCTIAYVGT